VSRTTLECGCSHTAGITSNCFHAFMYVIYLLHRKMDSYQLEEKEIFTQYYAKLCSTLTDVQHLLPHFVAESIIKLQDEEYINSLSLSSQKVKSLLKHISGPLNVGHTKGFHTMLKILETHGTQATKELANEIKSLVSSGM